MFCLKYQRRTKFPTHRILHAILWFIQLMWSRCVLSWNIAMITRTESDRSAVFWYPMMYTFPSLP
jgi:hypothetical protein